MSGLTAISLLLGAYLAVFLESSCQWVRHALGAQIDLLPCLAVYAGCRTDLWTLVALALFGGLSFDAMTANPLGVSTVPLFLIGFGTYRYRDKILREQVFAQAMLGIGACAFAPLLTLGLMLVSGAQPVYGWGTAWQILVMAVGGLATPFCFRLFNHFNHAFAYPVAAESSFRPDREIKRGKS